MEKRRPSLSDTDTPLLTHRDSDCRLLNHRPHPPHSRPPSPRPPTAVLRLRSSGVRRREWFTVGGKPLAASGPWVVHGWSTAHLDAHSPTPAHRRNLTADPARPFQWSRSLAAPAGRQAKPRIAKITSPPGASQPSSFSRPAGVGKHHVRHWESDSGTYGFPMLCNLCCLRRLGRRSSSQASSTVVLDPCTPATSCPPDVDRVSIAVGCVWSGAPLRSRALARDVTVNHTRIADHFKLANLHTALTILHAPHRTCKAYEDPGNPSTKDEFHHTGVTAPRHAGALPT